MHLRMAEQLQQLVELCPQDQVKCCAVQCSAVQCNRNYRYCSKKLFNAVFQFLKLCISAVNANLYRLLSSTSYVYPYYARFVYALFARFQSVGCSYPISDSRSRQQGRSSSSARRGTIQLHLEFV